MNLLKGAKPKIDKIIPTYIYEKNYKYLEVDGRYFSTIVIVDYSRISRELIFTKLIDSDINFKLSIFYEKLDRYNIIKELTYYIGTSGVEIKEKGKNSQDIDLVAFSHNDARYIRKEMQINNANLFNIYTYITVEADTKEKLYLYIKKIEEICMLSNLTIRKAFFRQIEGYINTLPFNKNSNILKEIAQRNILSEGIQITYPFILSNLSDKKRNIIW